jgi:quinol-cytochrome oxidoreductase complex cytochrome b subunit
MEKFGIFYSNLVFDACFSRLVCFVIIPDKFPHFGMLHQEKSGNPEVHRNVQNKDEVKNKTATFFKLFLSFFLLVIFVPSAACNPTRLNSPFLGN